MSVLARLLPYALAFTSSLCIMILELVSSRLVARHVGSSLTVWTSVIGIILGGICLGNVLGGRLSDRVEPRRAVGPLFALGAFLTLCALWVNAEISHILPNPAQMNWEFRTILVVLIDFLIPATVLGMIGPVVAKMAVEQARRAGSAIGDVYFWGAVGSIAGTLLCGFVLQVRFGTTGITLLVAAALSVLAASLMTGVLARVSALLTAILLVLGSNPTLVERIGPDAVTIGLYRINYLVAGGYVVAFLVAVAALAGLVSARRLGEVTPADELAPVEGTSKKEKEPIETRTGLRDLAALAFVASLVFMALEMVAGRLVARHLGSSIYGWSSVIAVLLAGLSFGNFLGGKLADFIKNEKQASWLFLLASILILSVLVLETPPQWVLDKFFNHATQKSLLMYAPGFNNLSIFHGPDVPLTWPYRILIVVTMIFLLPALSLGTVSPVVAKLAVDRLKRFQRTGTAIGQVYAWGMVGSILGTFLTGFVLIDILGTKGVILVLGTVMALGATFLGDLFHAVWAGIPLGLCVIAFTPPGWTDLVAVLVPQVNSKSFVKMGEDWGVREPVGDPATTADTLAWVDESDYYYIKIENEPEDGGELQKRTLVLDNLIHGYFILNHPERLDYDYEHIYALVAYRAAKAGGKVIFKPVSETTPDGEAPASREVAPPADNNPRPKPAESPKDMDKAPVKSAQPAKPADTPPAKPTATPPAKSAAPPASVPEVTPKSGGGLMSLAPSFQDGKSPADPDKKQAPAPDSKGAPVPAKDAAADGTKAEGDAGQAKPVAPDDKKAEADDGSPGADLLKKLKGIKDLTDLKQALSREGRRSQPYLPPVESSSLKTLFLGGGAYCFQRHMRHAYPGTGVDVAEIDPAVTRANFLATGLTEADKIETHWGDARQFVELNQDNKKYDLIFGDAFNDFSVPWHLTTREFNEKLKKMLTPDGVYMINIIDVYLSDAEVPKKIEEEIADREQDLKDRILGEWQAKGKRQHLSDEEVEKRAEEEIKKVVPLDGATKQRIREKWEKKAKIYGGFVGAWTKTAMLTFGEENVYIFGTDTPGEGRRETFVVVASMKPLDLKELGLRKDDPRYFTPRGKQTTPKPYGEADFNTVVNDRSRGIILTDDFAPVENLLAPVAETRGDRE
jgi:MFS family permease